MGCRVALRAPATAPVTARAIGSVTTVTNQDVLKCKMVLCSRNSPCSLGRFKCMCMLHRSDGHMGHSHALQPRRCPLDVFYVHCHPLHIYVCMCSITSPVI